MTGQAKIPQLTENFVITIDDEVTAMEDKSKHLSIVEEIKHQIVLDTRMAKIRKIEMISRGIGEQ